MKKKSKITKICLAISVIITVIYSCGRPSNESSFVDVKSKTESTLRLDSIQNELALYLQHARKCKTEYEVKSFTNSLPHMRANEINRFGNEENWKNQLAWLKVHGATKLGFTTNDSIPIFRRKERSPFEH